MEPTPRGKATPCGPRRHVRKMSAMFDDLFPCGPAATALAWLFLHTYIRPPRLARQAACHGDSGRSGRKGKKRGDDSQAWRCTTFGRGLIITTSGPGLYHLSKGDRPDVTVCCPRRATGRVVGGGGKKFGDARLAPGGKRRLQLSSCSRPAESSTIDQKARGTGMSPKLIGNVHRGRRARLGNSSRYNAVLLIHQWAQAQPACGLGPDQRASHRDHTQ